VEFDCFCAVVFYLFGVTSGNSQQKRIYV